MNWDQMEGKWKQYKGKMKQQWGKLTDDDLDRIDGKRQELVGRLQEHYGIQKQAAEKQADEFLQGLPRKGREGKEQGSRHQRTQARRRSRAPVRNLRATHDFLNEPYSRSNPLQRVTRLPKGPIAALFGATAAPPTFSRDCSGIEIEERGPRMKRMIVPVVLFLVLIAVPGLKAQQHVDLGIFGDYTRFGPTNSNLFRLGRPGCS